MNTCTSAVNAFPAVIDQRYSAMTIDFMVFGACVYENSSDVMDTMISPAVSSA